MTMSSVHLYAFVVISVISLTLPPSEVGARRNRSRQAHRGWRLYLHTNRLQHNVDLYVRLYIGKNYKRTRYTILDTKGKSQIGTYVWNTRNYGELKGFDIMVDPSATRFWRVYKVTVTDRKRPSTSLTCEHRVLNYKGRTVGSCFASVFDTKVCGRKHRRDKNRRKLHPWFALISFPDQAFKCGAVIINPRWVLTSFHCVYIQSSVIDTIVVQYGLNKNCEPSYGQYIEEYEVYKVNHYAGFLLLKLADSIKYTKNVRPICLNNYEMFGIPNKHLFSKITVLRCDVLIDDDRTYRYEYKRIPISMNTSTARISSRYNIPLLAESTFFASPVVAIKPDGKWYVIGFTAEYLEHFDTIRDVGTIYSWMIAKAS